MSDTNYLDNGVADLNGTLPVPCKRDVDTLRSFVRLCLQREAPAAPHSADNFSDVFLTGATGFIGRYVLKILLERNPNLTVHCLVRGASTEESEMRLQSVLEKANLWNNEVRNRIRIVTGDINEDRFGLSAHQFALLCSRIDAIFHFAAELSLISPYLKLRQSNIFSVQNILQLSLTTRIKHVFFASTMSVFPEYFCRFNREFTNHKIQGQTQPDVDLMKQHFPLGITGYPWSKLVVEQALLNAHSEGMPLAIFRLPLTNADSNGVSQASDVMVRFLNAVNDVEVSPPVEYSYAMELVDTLAEICVAISTNPNRQYTIYHCCDSKPAKSKHDPSELGIYIKQVPYHSFKRACLKRGKKSPLHGLWPLFDHFAPYWFEIESNRNNVVHVDDHAIRTDCPISFNWRHSMINEMRTWKWIDQNQSQWPYPLPKVKLEYDRLLTSAKEYADQMEVNFDECYPQWMLNGLNQLVQSFTTAPVEIRNPELGLVALTINRALLENARFARERQLHREIDAEKITQPVFILGMNRTGTTYLHRMLSRDSRFWTLKTYELVDSVLTDGDYAEVAGTDKDPRRTATQMYIELSDVRENMAGIHHIDLDEPEEELRLFVLAFAAWAMNVRYRIPDYGKWLPTASWNNVYRYHRQILEHFSWHRRLVNPGASGGQWLLKMPFHMMEIEALLEAYPDALFIQTHRAPVEFMGSWISLVEHSRRQVYSPQPHKELATEQLDFMRTMMSRVLDFRTQHPELADRWVDIRFSDLVKSPMKTVQEIYNKFNWSLESGTLDTLTNWQTRQADKRKREARHQYRLTDYALTPKMVNSAFEDYLEFVDHLNF